MQYLLGSRLELRPEGRSHPLFTDLGFELGAEARVGLIGANGSGKTTLLHLLEGSLSADSGDLRRMPGLRTALLPQQAPADSRRSAEAFLWAGHPALWELKLRLQQGPADSPAWLEAFADYEAAGGYLLEARCLEHLERSGLHEAVLQRSLGELSGGERTRLALARFSLVEADLLLLDEPDTHLDEPGRALLEGFLAECRRPYVLCSHDRELLDRCTTTTWALAGGSLVSYPASCSSYLEHEAQEERRMQHEAREHRRRVQALKRAAEERRQWAESHQPTTGGEGRAHVYECVSNRARKSMKRARAVETRLEAARRSLEAQQPVIRRRRSMRFEKAEGAGRSLLRCEGLGARPGGEWLFRRLSLRLQPGESLALRGANGCGKSTLLRMLAGRRPAEEGEIHWSPGARIGCYSPDHEDLDHGASALQAVLGDRPGEQGRARTLLACLCFPEEALQTAVGDLSSGERSKVALARLLHGPFTVLLLDEPQSHLELEARVALEEALADYRGSLVFVSHDSRFRERLATQELDLQMKTLSEGLF